MKKYFIMVICLMLALWGSAAFAAEKSDNMAWEYAAMKSGEPLAPHNFPLRAVGDNDVLVDILYAGICHSDIHLVNDEHGPIVEYPYTPGHEIVGRVSAVGKDATRLKVNDIVAIGSMLDSCGKCEYCQAGLEQYCINGAAWTGGGYGTRIVVDERFALVVPKWMTFDSHILTSGGKSIMGSSIGGMKETEEMLRYSAQHKIYPDVEVISADKINEAFKRVKAGDVQFRFVIDTSTIKK